MKYNIHKTDLKYMKKIDATAKEKWTNPSGSTRATLSITDRTCRPKIRSHIEQLNNTINQLD